MLSMLSGYQIEAEIFRSDKSLILRAVREADQKVVVIKTLASQYPSRKEVARFQHEYQLTHSLGGVPGVIQTHALEHAGNSIAMVLEHFHGVNLAQHLQASRAAGTTPFFIEPFLHLAIGVVEILKRIHQGQVIHKDVNPRNILWNEATGAIRVIDFGIATELAGERQELGSQGHLEGSLVYISPEQTGRMNRQIDYRTDYYSLGVSLYELVTGGELPFVATDTMGWVYCHIAKVPPSPSTISPVVPEMLSQIILKLMAKNPEERYQSSLGLLVDLQTCLNEWTAKGTITEFPLGRADRSEKFQISQTLYGREKETENLLAGFAQVALGKTEMACVTGHSGIGKSSLVHEVQKPIVHSKGYFIEGKFDQFERDMPYRAVILAFQGLLRQILSEPAQRLVYWQNRLRNAMGPNGQLMLDILPLLQEIIGPQPPVQKLNPDEAKNRFLVTFRNFVGAVATQDHPLVIFLDDLQWSDAATLHLIENLMCSQEVKFVYLIGAYRQNEVGDGHPLLLALGEVEKVKCVRKIQLQALAEDIVSMLVADTLHEDVETVRELASLIFQKTHGNPFFVNELLKGLHREGYLQISTPSGRWQWDITRIEAMDVSANVVDFMIDRLKKFSSDTQSAIQLAACIGNRFDLRTLALIANQSILACSNALWHAVRDGILVPTNDQYSLLQAMNKDSSALDEDAYNDGFEVRFQFQHDRVQQAAYGLIADDQKTRVHLQIGRLLRENLSTQDQQEQVIDIVRHLNRGRELIVKAEELKQLAQLNLLAAKKAKASTAYQPALEYLKIGMSILSADVWTSDYELAFSMAWDYSECAYLCGEFDTAEAQSENLLQRAQTDLEKATVLRRRVGQYIVIGKLDEAIAVGLQALALLGIDLSVNSAYLDVIREVLAAKWNLGRRPIASLSDLAEMTDPKLRLGMKLLMELGPSAYITGNENLMAVLAVRQVNLSMRYGNCPESAYAYAFYALILGGMLNDLKGGYAFGQLGMRLNALQNDLELKCRIFYMYTTFTHVWNQHFRSLASYFKEGVEAGFQSGDLFYLSYSACFLAQWETHINIPSAILEGKKIIAIVEDAKYKDALHSARIFQQFRQNLVGQTASRLSLNGGGFDEEAALMQMRQSRFATGVAFYHLTKLHICYLYGDFTAALGYVREMDAQNLVRALVSSSWSMDFCLYSFLTFSALLPGMDPQEKRKGWQRLKREYKRMGRWAAHCPENFQSLYLLMGAEMARLTDKPDKAASMYDNAIFDAKVNGYLSYEALINEVAGRYYLHQKRLNIAESYMREASYACARWGASAKAQYLAETHPQLLAPKIGFDRRLAHGASYLADQTINIAAGGTASLDLQTISKAARTLSGEVVPKELFMKLMTILRENAGSNKEILLLTQDGSPLLIQARRDQDGDYDILGATPFEDSDGYARSVIQYVARTRDHVVLEAAAQYGEFTQDPYIRRSQAKSVLCVPLLTQGNLSGILYLENSLVTNAFTPDRLETLRVLASQAAISIENSSLYANLEDKVSERTRQLSGALAQLEQQHQQLKTTQAQLIQAEKMASLGQLVANVAHEINTPIGAIKSSGASIASALEEALKNLPKLIETLDGQMLGLFTRMVSQSREPRTALTTREERAIRRQAAGELDAAGIEEPDFKANILVQIGAQSALANYLPLLRHPDCALILDTVSSLAAVSSGTGNINTAVERVSKIVFALKSLSSPDNVHEMTSASLQDTINAALALYASHIKQGTQLVCHFDAMPGLRCLPDELQQVWINLIHNALQAMGYQGTLTVALRRVGNEAVVSIGDTGSGIPEDIRARIFEPFFTTKREGEGSGLGLGVVKKTIDKHKGRIEVQSEVDVGSTFSVFLPL
jgi:histidine kinase